MKSRQQAFTLIELMIVVATIAVVAAIAIPSLTRSRIAANEATTVNSLRTITTVNDQYKMRFGSYALSLAELEATEYIDSLLASGTKSGYDFALAGGFDDWTCLANPVTPGRTGDRFFYVDQTGVIRFAEGGPANNASSPID